MDHPLAEPDVLVEKDGEGWYGEVELGDESKREWKNLAALNRGQVALCAVDEEGRTRLVRLPVACRSGVSWLPSLPGHPGG